MSGKDVLEGFSFVDEELIWEAEQEHTKRKCKPYKTLLAIAASLVIITASVSILRGSNKAQIPNEPDKLDTVMVSKEPEKKDKLYFNPAKSESEAKIYIEGYFAKKLSEEQGKKILPLISKTHKVSGIVNYSKKKDGKVDLFSVQAGIVTGKDRRANITISPKEVVKCEIIEGEPIISEIQGIKVIAGVVKSTKKGEDSCFYYADFKIGEVAYYVTLSGTVKEEAKMTSLITEIIKGGKADLSVFKQ